MSDGPYKSLKMNRPWKAVAKVAANPAHSTNEIAEALRSALLDDWKSVRPAFAQAIQSALGDNERGDLFFEVPLVEVARLRASASNPVEALLADQACDVARDGQVGAQAFKAAVKACLDECAGRRARQIEEHYFREASPDAGQLRARLGACIGVAGTDRMAAGIVARAGARTIAPKIDRSGLDEGVPFL